MSQQESETLRENTQKIILGRITGVYGVKGWVKIFSFTDPMEAIVDYSHWYVRPQNKSRAPWSRVKLKAGKRHAKTVVAKLEHCNDRDEAQAFIGLEIAIENNQLEVLTDKNEYYWRDLIGLRVINQQDIELGTVTSMLETGANDVLVVTSDEVTGSDTVNSDGAGSDRTDADKTGSDKTGSDKTSAEISGAETSGSEKKERLIPWTMQQAVLSVDLKNGVIRVDWDPEF